MERRPGERCGDCVWWYEGPILCEGCPNNPETEAKKTGSRERSSHGTGLPGIVIMP